MQAERAYNSERYVRSLEAREKQNPSAILVFHLSRLLQIAMEDLMTVTQVWRRNDFQIFKYALKRFQSLPYTDARKCCPTVYNLSRAVHLPTMPKILIAYGT